MNTTAWIACMLLGPAAAPPSDFVTEHLTVQRFLTAVIRSHGSPEQLAKRRCYYWRAEGTLSVGSETFPLKKKMWSKLPSQVRVECEYRSEEGETSLAVAVWDGRRMWSSVDGVTTELPKSAQVTTDVGYYARLLPLRDDPQLRVALLAERTINGRQAVGIRVSGCERATTSIYFDKKSHLLVMIEGTGYIDGKPVPETLHVSDYKKVAGGYWPMKRVRIWGDRREEIVVKEITFLDDIDKAKFKKP
jgi:hypothetical protein